MSRFHGLHKPSRQSPAELKTFTSLNYSAIKIIILNPWKCFITFDNCRKTEHISCRPIFMSFKNTHFIEKELFLCLEKENYDFMRFQSGTSFGCFRFSTTIKEKIILWPKSQLLPYGVYENFMLIFLIKFLMFKER